MTMDAKKYIIDNWGEEWLKLEWEAGDVQDALEEYAELSYKAKLKKELFAFNKWMCRKEYDGQIPFISTCIDEYLKQRNETKININQSFFGNSGAEPIGSTTDFIVNLLSITDEDIEAWADKQGWISNIGVSSFELLSQGFIEGAKAVLNGEIKHIE